MTTFSGLSIVNNSTLTLINASASDRGAQSRVESGDQGTAWGVDRLNTIAKAENDYQAEKLQTGIDTRKKLNAQDSSKNSAARSRILAEHYRKLAANMAAALDKLGGQSRSSAGTVVALFKTPDSDALSIVSGKTVRNVSSQNEASFAIRASTVKGVYTRGGNDAISIEADWVESVYTDRSSGLHAKKTKSGDTVLGWHSKTVSNDAVAIKAKRVSSVYTKGGNDAIAIETDLVKAVYAGEGSDSVAIRAGVVNGVYSGDGHDTISVDAGIGGTAVTKFGATYIGISEVTSYTRAETAEERVKQARLGYAQRADINAGAGDDFISVTVEEALTIDGGTGNDTIAIGGGTVGMSVRFDSGHDTVQVARGAEFVLRVEENGPYTVKKDGNDLIVTHAGGSVTIKDYEQASAIAVRGRYAASEDEINDLLSPEEAQRTIAFGAEQKAKLREERTAKIESFVADGDTMELAKKSIDIPERVTVPKDADAQPRRWEDTLSSPPMAYGIVMFHLDPKEPVDQKI